MNANLASSDSFYDDINLACDRFEAGWKAGRPRRIEDEMAAADDPIQARLFGELLSLEIELLRQGGRFADVDGYLARFPDQADAVRARFADPDADHEHAETLVRSLAERGLRVLAVAQRSWDNGTTDDEETDADAVDAAAQDLKWLGYVGLADTARASSRPLIEALLDADRDVVLITGDHPITARAIARQLGLPADARVVTGAELAGLDEDASAKLAADVQVFARVSPEQKVQIVAALQRCGRVTAMVGDGANDAAAIRMADVGIGVSGRGS